MAVHKTRRLYRSGHYYNGQGVSYAGSLLKNGYYVLKVNKKHVSTHRAVAWFWPRDGRRPLMPWMLDVDHVDKNYETIDYTQLRWVTRQTHNRKYEVKKKNNGNSRPIHGRLVGEDAHGLSLRRYCLRYMHTSRCYPSTGSSTCSATAPCRDAE